LDLAEVVVAEPILYMGLLQGSHLGHFLRTCVQVTCPTCSKALTIDLTNTAATAAAAVAADGAGSSKAAAAAAGGGSSRTKANSILARIDRYAMNESMNP
jgi:hypothetical protein